jgi:hypothetical protein
MLTNMRLPFNKYVSQSTFYFAHGLKNIVTTFVVDNNYVSRSTNMFVLLNNYSVFINKYISIISCYIRYLNFTMHVDVHGVVML